MPLLIPDGYAQVTIPMRHVSQGREAVVTFGIGPGVNPTNAVDVANNVHSIWMETFGEQQDAGVGIGPVRLRVGDEGGEILSISGTTVSEGGVQGDQLPPNVALLVTKFSARGGRRGRGRFFIPWRLQDAHVDDIGIIAGTPLADCQNEADALLAALADDEDPNFPLPMVLLHESEGNSAPGTPNQVVTLQVQSLVGTQRRRLGR